MAGQNQDFLHKLLATFGGEAQEHLQDIVSKIVLLEQGGDDAQLVERLLKRLHTLKGASRSVNLTDLEALCHAMEGVFSPLQGAACRLSSEQFDLLHEAGKLMHSLLQQPSGRIRNQAAALCRRLDGLSAEIRAAQADGAAPASMPKAGAAPDQARDPSQSDMIRVHGRQLDAIRHQAEGLLSVDLNLQHQIADLLQLADELADCGDRPLPAHAARSGGELALRCRRLAQSLSLSRRNLGAMRLKLIDATLEAAMAPIAGALQPLPGLVRNLARDRGKQAKLSIEGASLQVDRRILDIARDALLHLVTNAVDHGIEPAQQRLARGKPAAGMVAVRVAQYGGNRISIAVTDDGAGIDVPGIASAAARVRGLDARHIATLGDQQKLQLALESGVTTSSEITQVSGRGVGLSIVREKIAEVGGELTIASAAGAGCSFQLLLPVRVSTLRGLVLRAGGLAFVLPLSGVEMACALRKADMHAVANRQMLPFGGRMLPVARLAHVLQLDRRGEFAADEANIALIINAGAGRLALLVDAILSEQEVLPKSLGKQLRRVRYISGATQLGDGSLVPILALEDLARHALASQPMAAPDRQAGGASGPKRVLLAEDSLSSRLLLRHMLEQAGYQVETAGDGLEAWSRLRQGDFDALVSDVEMPRLDGLALIEKLRADPITMALPVVLVTSLQSPDARQRGLQAGADAYVAKGAFARDDLLAALERLIQKKGMQ